MLNQDIQDTMLLQGQQGILGTGHGQEGVVDNEQRPLTMTTQVSRVCQDEQSRATTAAIFAKSACKI